LLDLDCNSFGNSNVRMGVIEMDEQKECPNIRVNVQSCTYTARVKDTVQSQTFNMHPPFSEILSSGVLNG